MVKERVKEGEKKYEKMKEEGWNVERREAM